MPFIFLCFFIFFFFFNDTATTEIYTLSLHDALPISPAGPEGGWDRSQASIPSLLLTGAVHHHLIRERTRTRVGLVVECGDAREAHHIALLIGYGAAAVNPYLALGS